MKEEKDPERSPPPNEELELSSEEGADLEPGDAHPEEGPEVLGPSDSEVLEAAIFAAQFSGPLPPPEILQAYDEVVEGGATRIFDQWERETEHRQSLERRAVDAYLAGFTRAQWMAFIVILTIGVGGLIIVALGHALVGFAGFFLALAAVAASFFREKGSRRAAFARESGDDQDSEQ